MDSPAKKGGCAILVNGFRESAHQDIHIMRRGGEYAGSEVFVFSPFGLQQIDIIVVFDLRELSGVVVKSNSSSTRACRLVLY